MSQTVLAGNLFDQKTGNLLANGGFELWNNGVSWNQGDLLVGTTFVADGWQTQCLNSTFSLTRGTTADTGQYSVKFDVTVSPVGSKTTLFYSFLDALTGASNAQFLQGKTVSFSARVKCNSAGKVRMRIFDISGESYSAYHTGDNTWQTLTVTKTIATNVTYLYVYIGQNDTTTDVGICTFYIDSVIAVVGSKPVEYIPENPEIEKVMAGAVTALQQNVSNILINGGFNIWQRGTSFSCSSSNVKCADGWELAIIGGGATISATRASAPAQGAPDGTYCMNWSLSGSFGGGYTKVLRQTVTNPQRFGGKYLTFSVWVKCNATYVAALRISTTGTGAFLGTSSGNVGTGWELLSVTTPVAINPASSVIRVEVTNLSDTPNIYIMNASLVVGSVVMPYISEDPAIELMRCQRYYQTLGKDFSTQYVFLPLKGKTGEANGPAMLPVTMAAIPTITFSSQTAFTVDDSAGSQIATTAMSYASLNPRGSRIQAVSTAGVAGQSHLLYGNSVNAYIAYEVG
jgi:hypothetical protein